MIADIASPEMEPSTDMTTARQRAVAGIQDLRIVRPAGGGKLQMGRPPVGMQLRCPSFLERFPHRNFGQTILMKHGLEEMSGKVLY
jgi:hypothetical protein